MSLKICKECGTEVSKSAKTCPKCGRKLKHTAIRVVIGVIVVIVGIGYALGLNDTTNTTASTSTSSILKQEDRFTLVSDKKVTDSLGTTYIEGEISNNTNKDYTYAQVTFNLYDSNGNQLGTAVDNINNFEAKGTWKYKAIGLVTEKVAKYKLVEITGW